jgi:CTP-dependent riboflavin kinase
MKIIGYICEGAKKSSKWMKKENPFPFLYPGTLNIKLNSKKPFIKYIDEISLKRGVCKIAKCKINDISAFIILPPTATLGNNYVEIGHKENLRNLFNLKTNDQVIIEFL